MDEVNVGVIGTSYMADLLHIPALQSHPKAIVRAICGRNRDRAEEVAKKHEIPLCFTDYSEMIRQGD